MTRRSCAGCGYDLSGTPAGADGVVTCPECGKVRGSAVAPGPCRQCGYDLSGTPVRGDGVAWVCPECRYVSRVEDWDSSAATESPRSKRRAKWLAEATALNVFALAPAVFCAAWMLGKFWYLSLGAGAVMLVVEGAICERAEARSLHRHWRVSGVLGWAAGLGACVLASFVIVLMLVVGSRLRR